MPTTRLSSKGQIVIPKSVREAHDWEPGQEFEIVAANDSVVLRPKKPFSTTTLEQVVGCANYDGPRVPTDQLTGSHAPRLEQQQQNA